MSFWNQAVLRIGQFKPKLGNEMSQNEDTFLCRVLATGTVRPPAEKPKKLDLLAGGNCEECASSLSSIERPTQCPVFMSRRTHRSGKNSCGRSKLAGFRWIAQNGKSTRVPLGNSNLSSPASLPLKGTGRCRLRKLPTAPGDTSAMPRQNTLWCTPEHRDCPFQPQQSQKECSFARIVLG